MSKLLPAYMQMIQKYHKDILLRDEFFETRPCPAIGRDIRTIKPVLQYPDGEVELKFNVGTRTNGIDKAHWPADLSVEIVR